MSKKEYKCILFYDDTTGKKYEELNTVRPDIMKLSYAKVDKIPLIDNHNYNRVGVAVGYVDNIKIEYDGSNYYAQGVGVIDPGILSEEEKKVITLIDEGMGMHLSMGFQDLRLTEIGDSGLYDITDMYPSEVSLTYVPADTRCYIKPLQYGMNEDSVQSPQPLEKTTIKPLEIS